MSIGRKGRLIPTFHTMGTPRKKDWDGEYSEIGDKVEVGFLDFQDDMSLGGFDPLESGPVVISKPFPFISGKPQSTFVGNTFASSITIKNTTDEPIELWSVQIFSSNPEDSYLLSLMKPPPANADEREIHEFVGSNVLEDRVLQPRQTLTIWLSCRPKEIGLHTSIVHFDVGSDKIERVAFLLVDDNVSQALFSNKPYTKAPLRKKMFEYNNYVAGYRPSRWSKKASGFNLPQYAIPEKIREIVESKQFPDILMDGLNITNYARYFSTLINMEEIHLEEEMIAHDMACVHMRRRGNQLLSLEVPGLAERRPSLVIGDFILAKLATENSDSNSCPYQGFIHHIEADEILLKFDKIFHQIHRNEDVYNVSFTYNRVNMRRLYHAVEATECLADEILFPSQSSNRRMINTVPFQPFNPSLNREQLTSIEMILGCNGFPPYVIHGPPGTGKTMTLVEAILQLYSARKRTRILVCASSNSAADHILEKLLAKDGTGVRESEIFRLNAISRPYGDVKPELICFCFFDEATFKCPPLKALMRYRVIISTYTSASFLHTEGIHKGHFSHIFLDEAAQVSEPEAMVPIANLSLKETVIVLAGDPMQLGPVVYSRDAENYGLGKSYLERLFESEQYGGGDQNYVTKLLMNYRNHPAILELPSKLFYRYELLACKDDDESSVYDVVNLPNKTFPVLFVGIQGCDEREGCNPSWFNRIEASKTVEIIRKLLRNTEITEDDIGVITPYRQQVLKLQKALESLEISNIKVGSVEQFQGQERRIIIISTVRSTVKHNEFDKLHNLGFLSNPHRFNVAITRAKSLLIIVGNPHIITKDPYWDKLLRYCADNGSYQGCPLPPQERFEFPILSERPESNVVEWACDPDQYANEVEHGEGDLGKYNKNTENQYEEEASIAFRKELEWGEDELDKYPEESERLNNASKSHSNEEDEWSYENCQLQQIKSTESEKAGESNRLDGAVNEEFMAQNTEYEWKGLTFTPTGWDD